ncbi:MAG TPA: SdrD B-like domain-containing protein [Candidatus Paceibacterota bacterium]|nr:SdrD B-like domain-containing protein [Candidatus Paceibacterota bacterium]
MKRYIPGVSSALVGLAFLVLPALASASTLTVDNSGTCDDTGTTPPYCTIQAAVNHASSGDTINVAAGTYTEDVIISTPVTITGATGAKLVVADGASSNGFTINANNVTIQGFDIEGPADQSYTTYPWGSNITRGIVVKNGFTGFTITNNTIANLRNDILIDGRNTTGSVTNNVIDNSKSGISVQYTDGTGITISGNTQGLYGNDWGMNLHLNGNWDGTTVHSNPYPGGTAPLATQSAILALSTANAGWSVQDQGYTAANRTAVTVATTGAAGAQGDPLGPIDTFQNGVNAVVTGGTVNVAAGTYSGNVVIATGNLTIKGTGSVILNLDSGYGFDLDEPGNVATGFAMSGITVNASPATTYAFKAYKADGLTLTDDTFNGGSGNTGGGVDINTTSHVLIDGVTADGFHKNGFAVTAAYTAGDQATPSSDITFNNITASNNGWTGISFYTIGNDNSPTSIGGSANISGVHFTGSNIISGNGGGAGNGAGIHIEGDDDANEATYATPANTVTSDGTTLDLTHIAFSGDAHTDIANYQTAPVNAIGATFGGLTGDAMNATQRTTEDGMIIDQLDHPNLGLVTYYTAAPSTYTVTIDKFIDGVAASTTAATASFPMASSWNAANIGGAGSGTYALSPVDSYEAVTAAMDAGSTYTTNEDTSGTVVGADCSADPYELIGYSSGPTFAAALAADQSTTPPNFSNLASNEYVIVWNDTCAPASTVKVHILKYLDGSEATAASANNYLFPMQSSWSASNIGSGSGSYTLGDNFGGATDAYGADTAAMSQGATYSTNEIVDDPSSEVVSSLASCAPGKYLLQGYKTSLVNFADAAQNATSSTAAFTDGLTSDAYVIVYNASCPTTATLTVYKDTIGGNDTFNFNGTNGIGNFQITTAGGVGSQTFSNLAPGTYTVTETSKSGWTQTDSTCTSVVLDAGDNLSCTLTNTKNTKLGAIRGTTFEDWDGDGSSFETRWEVAVPNVTVYLDTNNNGHWDTGELTTVSDKHGIYSFLGLAAGTYHVREIVPTGSIETYPSSGVYTFALAAGQIARNKDFGTFKLGSISGTVYNDKNKNGHKDKGEAGLAGWTVKLKGPYGTVTTTTDANGNYSFTGLKVGKYTLSEIVQNGWKETDSPNIVRVDSGTNSTKNNFGDKQK